MDSPISVICDPKIFPNNLETRKNKIARSFARMVINVVEATIGEDLLDLDTKIELEGIISEGTLEFAKTIKELE